MSGSEPAAPPAPPDEARVRRLAVIRARLRAVGFAALLSRRRAALVALALVGAWVVISFGRQVSDAAAASDRAAALRATNDALRTHLAALQLDIGRAQSDQYVGVAARGDGLGKKHEIPVALAAGAPSLPPDAPGSAALRVGGQDQPKTPLEAWLDLLFGPGG